MHKAIALLRHIHGELHRQGLGIVPFIFGKFRTECGLLIGLLCAAAAVYDLARRRWAQGSLWIAAAVLQYLGFQATSNLWSPPVSLGLGAAAIAAALGAVLLTFYEMLQDSLAKARRERREMRRVPGAAPRSISRERRSARPHS